MGHGTFRENAAKYLVKGGGLWYDTGRKREEERIMNCPYCQEEMQLGYVQCRDGLNWTPRKAAIAALAAFGRGGVPLVNGASWMTNTAAYAYHCAMCKRVIIPYGETLAVEEA